MILQIPPESPLWVHVAADTVRILHISGGAIGLVSGAVAMIARKGGRLHRAAGNAFFASMLVMSGIGAVIAPLLPERISSVAGVVTFYLVATAWATVRRAPNTSGHFEIGAALVALTAAIAGITFGLMAANSPAGTLDGLPPVPGYLMAGIAATGAAFDLNVILRGGVAGPDRIARHLWRMSVALFIAAASFFLGQPKFLPAWFKDSLLPLVPELLVLGAMIFWLARTQLARFFRRHAAATS